MHARNRTYRSALIVFSAFMLLSLSGCDKIPALDFLKPKTAKAPVVSTAAVSAKGPIVAKVNNMPIGLEDLNEEVESYNAIVPQDKPEAKITTREQKIDYLKNEMIRRALLYQKALDMGIERKEEIQNALEKTKQNLLVMELVREEAEKIDVSSKDIEDYYNLYKEQLKEPEERRIREIMVPTESEAKEVMIQLLQGEDFSTVARNRSRAQSAKEGGDLGYIQRGAKSAQFDSVAFSETLDKGNVSSIFKGTDGYYILKVEDKRGGQQKTLSEMWDDIKRALTFLKQQQRIEELVSQVSQEAKIEIYEGEIK